MVMVHPSCQGMSRKRHPDPPRGHSIDEASTWKPRSSPHQQHQARSWEEGEAEAREGRHQRSCFTRLISPCANASTPQLRHSTGGCVTGMPSKSGEALSPSSICFSSLQSRCVRRSGSQAGSTVDVVSWDKVPKCIWPPVSA